MAPEALAKPPVPEEPVSPQVYCYQFEEPVTILLPGGEQITSKHFEYAVWQGLKQFKNNKNKQVLVYLGREVWAEGYGIIYDTFVPDTANFLFPSCGPS